MENKNRANHSTLKYLKMLPLIALVIGCILILQLHAIPKWQELTGFYGMYMSILLELLGVYAWLYKIIPLAISSSLLLISVPLFQLVTPAYQEALLYNSISNNIEASKRSIARNESLLNKYVEQTWAGKATKIEASIFKHEKILIQLRQQLINMQTPGLIYIGVSIETVALIIFLLAQISLLRTIRNMQFVEKRFNDIELVSHGISETDNIWKVPYDSLKNKDIPSRATSIFERLCEYKEKHGISWKKISNILEVPPSTLTRIKNIIDDKPDKASFNMLMRVINNLDKLAVIY